VQCIRTSAINNTSSQTKLIICAPVGIVARMNVGNIPLGALGEIEVFLWSGLNLDNILVTIQPTCPSEVQAYSSNRAAIFMGNRVLIKNIKVGDYIHLKFYYIPYQGKNCTIYLDVRANVEVPIINTSKTVTTAGYSKIYRNYPTNVPETIEFSTIMVLAAIMLLLFA